MRGSRVPPGGVALLAPASIDARFSSRVLAVVRDHSGRESTTGTPTAGRLGSGSTKRVLRLWRQQSVRAFNPPARAGRAEVVRGREPS